jgi:hypothetical protein
MVIHVDVRYVKTMKYHDVTQYTYVAWRRILLSRLDIHCVVKAILVCVGKERFMEGNTAD